MARRFDSFTSAYDQSCVPFLLAEVVTDGKGEMVDLVCRYANAAAAALLDTTPESLRSRRFSRAYPTSDLNRLSPLHRVAFSGSAASFTYEMVLGRRLSVSCYQLQYGVCACILEEKDSAARPRAAGFSVDLLPVAAAVLEVGGGGIRTLCFNRRLCDLAGCSRVEFLNRFSGEVTQLARGEEHRGLVQCLMDAAKSGRPVDHPFLLTGRNGQTLRATLLAEQMERRSEGVRFSAVVLNAEQSFRALEAREQALTERAEALSRYDRLFDQVSVCQFHLAAGEEKAAVVRLSRPLSELLGYSQAELLKRAAADPLSRVYPEDRAALLSAWESARSAGRGLRTLFRVQRRGGEVRWCSLWADLRPPEGDGTFFAVCTDVTGEREAREEVRYCSELSRLLLARADTVSLDYEPRADLARIELFDGEGRHVQRTVSGYLHTLSASATVHPDSLEEVLSAMGGACAKPGGGEFRYLGNYGAQSFRWYQASYLSLADENGNVCRVIVRAEDISQQIADQERFRDQTARQTERMGSALCSARLDLTANTLLSARGETPHLMHTLFAGSAEGCLNGALGNIPDEDGRIRFAAAFSREALLESYRRGYTHAELEHRFFIDVKTARWVRTSAELAVNPENRHVEVCLHGEDMDAHRVRQETLQALAGQRFSVIAAIDAASRSYRSYTGKLPDGPDFYRAAMELADAYILPEQRKRLRSVLLVPNLTKQLKKEPLYTLTIPLRGEGESERTFFLAVSWLDPEKTTLLLTGTDVSRLTELRRRREEELTAELARAREDALERSRFLEQLSHEIRTPVGAILTMTERSLQSGDAAQAGGYLEKAARVSRYLQALTGDLLDLSRIDRGEMALHPAEFSLDSLLEDLKSLFSALTDQRRLQYDASVSPQVSDRLRGDSVKLRQILTNLLSNAVRYTPDGGHVTLEISLLRREGSRELLRLEVSDTGRGIAARDIPRLFEPFARVGKAAPDSTGLGLSICRALAERMGGGITVSSIVGVGSRFTVELPFTAVRTGDSAPSGLDGLRILLAEEPRAAEGLSGLLQSAGCAVDLVQDGLQALQRFASQPAGWYGAVLLGARLPVMDGAQAAAAIRRWEKADAKTVLILALGEGAAPEDIRRCLDAGANDFLARPPEPETLLRALKHRRPGRRTTEKPGGDDPAG